MLQRSLLRRLAASFLACGALLLVPDRVDAQSPTDLAARVMAFPHRVQTGDQIRFRVIVGNRAAGTTNRFKVLLNASDGIAVDMVLTRDGTVTQTATGRYEVRVDRGLALGETVEINVPARVTAASATPIRFTVLADEDAPSADVNRANNADSIATDVRPPNSPDLAVRVVDGPDPVPSGDVVTYAILVGNRSTAALEGVRMTTVVPEGATFGSAVTSQGTVTAPTPGQMGAIACMLGRIEPNAVATINVVLNVVAEPRSLLVLPVEVEDDALRSRSSGEMTFVVAEGDAFLAWRHPEPVGGELAPPREFRLQRARRGGPAPVLGKADFDALLVAPEESAATTYKVYASTEPGVSTSPNNIFGSLPPNQASSGAVSTESATYYVSTACYPNGESAASNEVSGGAGESAIETFTFTEKKITVTGTGFTDTVTVTIDGVAFEKAATVKKQKTKVIQKGKLATGETIGQYVTVGRTVFICFKNDTGATTCLTVTRQ